MRQSAKEDSLAKIPYRIFETQQFQDDLAELTAVRMQQIRKKLTEYIYPQLRDEPHFGRNITGAHVAPSTGKAGWSLPLSRAVRAAKSSNACANGIWRYRLADWRIFFEINDAERTIYLLTIAQRKDAYR